MFFVCIVTCPGIKRLGPNREWRRTTIVRPEQTRVGSLGFGMMAKALAIVLVARFKVHGPDELEPFLQQTDIALCLLSVLTFALLCTSGLIEHSIHNAKPVDPPASNGGDKRCH